MVDRSRQWKAIAKVVAAEFGTQTRTIYDRCQRHRNVYIRHIAWYIARVYCQWTTTEWCSVVGCSSTQPLTNALAKIEDMRDDPEFDAFIDRLGTQEFAT